MGFPAVVVVAAVLVAVKTFGVFKISCYNVLILIYKN